MDRPGRLHTKQGAAQAAAQEPRVCSVFLRRGSSASGGDTWIMKPPSPWAVSAGGQNPWVPVLPRMWPVDSRAAGLLLSPRGHSSHGHFPTPCLLLVSEGKGTERPIQALEGWPEACGRQGRGQRAEPHAGPQSPGSGSPLFSLLSAPGGAGGGPQCTRGLLLPEAWPGGTCVPLIPSPRALGFSQVDSEAQFLGS